MAMQESRSSMLLVPSEWDTSFFGFPVAEISNARIAFDELENLLRRARAQGLRLVYWKADPQVAALEQLLQEYHGMLVDRKVTYSLELAPPGGPPSRHRIKREPLCIAEYTARDASPQLIRLAIDAGQHSRFQVDPRFPTTLFVSLYEEWIRRSVWHELADIVFVAYGREDIPIGMVTASARDCVGEIGLLSVSEAHRGLGIGRALLSTAHEWMVERMATESQVTTQGRNASACAVYERCGYRQLSTKDVYHFWP